MDRAKLERLLELATGHSPGMNPEFNALMAEVQAEEAERRSHDPAVIREEIAEVIRSAVAKAVSNLDRCWSVEVTPWDPWRPERSGYGGRWWVRFHGTTMLAKVPVPSASFADRIDPDTIVPTVTIPAIDWEIVIHDLEMWHDDAGKAVHASDWPPQRRQALVPCLRRQL